MSYLIDTTLGLVLAIFFLGVLDKLASERDWVHLKHSGVYSGPDGVLHWISQCLAWLVILTVVKVIIYIFMLAGGSWLAWIGGVLFAPLQGNIRFELLFVMIFFPGILNVIYFWIADGYLKAKKSHAGAHEPDSIVDSKNAALMAGEQEMAAGGSLPPGNYQSAPWSAVTTVASPQSSVHRPETASV
jgi:hypothetical protein